MSDDHSKTNISRFDGTQQRISVFNKQLAANTTLENPYYAMNMDDNSKREFAEDFKPNVEFYKVKTTENPYYN